MSIRDIHTHNLAAGTDAVINLPFNADAERLIEDGKTYSFGIHPWDTANIVDWKQAYALLDRIAQRPEVAYIGETGLDALQGAPMEAQEEVFLHHVRLSEDLGKPMIIHAVKTVNRIIELRKELAPKQQWILHGFRGKPQQAKQLLSAGIDISLGEKFNPEVLDVIPAHKLYTETDDSELNISEIQKNLAKKVK